jgi:hypothetical protein
LVFGAGFRRFLTDELLVYTGLVAVDDLFGPLFGPVSTRSFYRLWDSISVDSYFQTPTYEILPVPSPNRVVAQ